MRNLSKQLSQQYDRPRGDSYIFATFLNEAPSFCSPSTLDNIFFCASRACSSVLVGALMDAIMSLYEEFFFFFFFFFSGSSLTSSLGSALASASTLATGSNAVAERK